MTTSDKTLLGIFILSLSIGVAQHGCTKRKVAHLSEKTIATQIVAGSQTTSTNGPDGDLTPPDTYVVNTHRRKDPSLSLNEIRRIAIRERNENMSSQQPRVPADDPNYFTAREGFKDMLFSDSSTGTSNLSDEEKWKLIESGVLAW